MKNTTEAKDWTPELRMCCQPPDMLPSDTRLNCLLVAFLGVQVQVNAPLHAQLWDDHQHVYHGQLQSAGVWTPTIVWLSEPPADTYWQWAQASPAPPDHSHHDIAPVAVDSHCPGCGGEVQAPCGVCGAQVPRAPEKRAPLLLARHGGYGAGGARPGPTNPPA